MKENRHGCLSRPIKQLLSTFFMYSKVCQLVEKAFSTSWQTEGAGGHAAARASGKLKVDTHKAGECLLFSYLLK